MKRLLTLGLLGLLSACQPAFATDRIPTAAEQYRRTLVRSAHAEWGLSAPIATFAAQVHQESRWRADARSPVGAQGLAQFMPGTAEWIAACALFARAFNELAEADVYEQTFWDEGKKEEILTYMIRFPKTGRKIQALSSRPSNLRGLQGDVVIDEAAFHESLEELLKAALALTMWGNKVRLISTHNGVDNPFNTYIQDAREGRKDYSIHRITLDDAIAEGLYKRICYVTGQAWSPESEKAWRDGLYKNAPNIESAEEEYGCVPKKSGGAYLSRVLIEQAMVADHSIRIHRYEAPAGFESWTPELREAEVRTWCEENLLPELARLSDQNRHTFGEDFARRGDLTVFTPLAISPTLRKRVPFQVELRNLTYEAQRDIMRFICDRLPRLSGLAFDATGNGGYRSLQHGDYDPDSRPRRPAAAPERDP